MLPFLTRKVRSSAGMSMEYRKPDEGKEPKMEDSALDAAADDLIKGISSGDKKMVVSALKLAFEILDAMPHVEGEHTNESSED